MGTEQAVALFAETRVLIFILVFLSCILFLVVVLIFLIGRNRRLKKDIYNLTLQQKFLDDHRRALENQISLNLQFQQEIAHHMKMMDVLTKSRDSNEIEKYEQELKALYQDLQRIDFCNNIIVDSVIQNASRECEAKGILFDVEMNNLRCEGIEDFDLLQVFYACLQHAISNCEKVSQMEKHISLKCNNVVGNLFIQVRYCSDKKPKHFSELTQLTISDCIRKYDGKIEESYRNNEVSITVMLGQIYES